MDIRRRYGPAAMAITGILLAVLAAGADAGTSAAAAPTSVAQADAPPLPRDVPKAAAQAMQLALKWHGDAQMIDVRIREANNYAIEFLFKSPSDRATLYAQSVNGQFTTQVMPPVTTAATGDPLPLEFLDLPAAMAIAEQKGMPPILKEASLQASAGKSMPLIWAIQPETDHQPYLYRINAAAAASPGTGNSASVAPSSESGAGAPARPTGGSTNLAAAAGEPVMASGLLQKCLGITPGSDRMTKGAATQEYC
ncbi:MAG TPA: hypothetical protein VKU84_11795, partial [Stellaceae bacterium]|nr:hypothetical protein [Stellaceae bacterium]